MPEYIVAQYHILRPMTHAEQVERGAIGFVWLHVRSVKTRDEAETFIKLHPDHIIRESKRPA